VLVSCDLLLTFGQEEGASWISADQSKTTGWAKLLGEKKLQGQVVGAGTLSRNGRWSKMVEVNPLGSQA
jgi:hypothetical protein